MSEQRATVIDSPAGIRGAQLCAQRGALKLEILGMTRRGQSVYSMLKKKYGWKGSRKRVLAQLDHHIAQFNKAHGFEKGDA